MASMTRLRVPGETLSGWFRLRETVQRPGGFGRCPTCGPSPTGGGGLQNRRLFRPQESSFPVSDSYVDRNNVIAFTARKAFTCVAEKQGGGLLGRGSVHLWHIDSRGWDPRGRHSRRGTRATQAGSSAATRPPSGEVIAGITQMPAPRGRLGRAHRADRLALLSRLADRLEERAEAIARALTLEQGKPIGEARGETGKSIAEFRQMLTFAAQPTGRVHATMRAGVRPITLSRPRGIIAAHALELSSAHAAAQGAPALAYGNAILLSLRS